jgi:hypothetical protein
MTAVLWLDKFPFGMRLDEKVVGLLLHVGTTD